MTNREKFLAGNSFRMRQTNPIEYSYNKADDAIMSNMDGSIKTKIMKVDWVSKTYVECSGDMVENNKPQFLGFDNMTFTDSVKAKEVKRV